MYERFYHAFSPFGEPNIPIDMTFLCSSSFTELLGRLHAFSKQHYRDHWVQVLMQHHGYYHVHFVYYHSFCILSFNFVCYRSILYDRIFYLFISGVSMYVHD